MDDEAAKQLALAARGDREAFGYLAAAFRGSLLTWCRQVASECDVEDVAQEALIMAFHRLGTLREPRAFPAWLRQLVRTAASRYYRKRRPDLLSEEHDQPAPPEEDDSAIVAQVAGAVKELTAYQQQAIELHYLQGQSVNEIAARLGVPQGTIKRRLFDAREKLRIKLAGLNGGQYGATDYWRG